MEQTRDGLVVVLDGIQDPHNLGAVIRTASCAGADGVVIPQDRAARVTAVVEKSSAGGVETIPIARVPNIAATLKLLKEAGFWVYGLVDTAATPLPIQDLTGRVALVIGSEGEGIRPLVAKHCDGLLAIPLRQGVGTLNASVAAGIALYDVIRQRETWREKE
jgi:23S rRNA (guanosine2251-2'-O)-methyltransferase